VKEAESVNLVQLHSVILIISSLHELVAYLLDWFAIDHLEPCVGEDHRGSVGEDAWRCAPEPWDSFLTRSPM
jgi:hypothetical protein